MITALARPLARLEDQKGAILAERSSWSGGRWRFRCDSASWSTLDVLDHVIKVEHALVEAVRANLAEARTIGFRDRAGAWFIVGVMQSPMRVKVPASAVEVLPAASADPLLIGARWQEVRNELKTLIGSLSPAQFKSGVFRHPISGWMNLPMATEFLAAHLRHHRYQLDRLARASSGV